jgi:anti-sigma regulatory factor (Ser/Thr protein kinase)
MMEFRVEIPHSNLNDAGADMRSRLMTWEWKSKLPDGVRELVLDFSKNRFIEPWALAQYVAWGLWVRMQLGIGIHIETDPANAANSYVLSMGIEQVLETGTSTTEWDESSQNTGLHVLRSHADVSRFVESARLLSLGRSLETLDALRYGMAELGRNVIQHAQSPIGGVAIAQYFPAAKAVQISICDWGCGVRESLCANYPEIRTDLEALKLAVLPHASGADLELGPYASLENAGLGLFFSKEIAWRAGGSFWLASRTALLGVQGDDEGAQHRVYRRVNVLPGASVTMHFPADGVVDFADLVHECQELARKARSASGPAALDFIDAMPEPFDGLRIALADFVENVEEAAAIRRTQILPAVQEGRWVVLDCSHVRFATQSFVHALLYEPLRISGGVLRLSFLHCSRATMEAVQTVAAYAASYRQIP